MNKMATMVITRSSGSSYLNRVELQNGSLSKALPTLLYPHETVNKDILTENIIDAYVSRVNHCKCGDTEINLYPGVLSEEKQCERTKLLTYLKGSILLLFILSDCRF